MSIAHDVAKTAGWQRHGELWLPGMLDLIFTPGGGAEPGCHCCACESGSIVSLSITGHCKQCADGQKHGPQYYRFRVLGLTNASCGDCDSINADYLLEATELAPTGWAYDCSATVTCNLYWLRAWVGKKNAENPNYPPIALNNYYMLFVFWFYVGTTNIFADWYCDFGASAPTCSCLSNLEFTYWQTRNGVAPCNMATATVHLIESIES